MKTVQVADSKKIRENLLADSQKKTIIFNLVCFVLGVFISKGIIFDEYLPFGASLIAAVPYKNLLSTLLGTSIGYFLPSELNIGIRYIVTVMSVALIRWALNDLKKINNSLFFAPFIAGTITLITGIVTNGTGNFLETVFSFNTVEAIFAGAFAYFFKETANLFNEDRTSFTLTQQEIASGFISLWTFILSFSTFSIWSISIGKVFSSFAILFLSRYLGVAGGSVSGISAAIIFGISSKVPSYLYGAYSFGGLMAGFASKFSKYIQSLIFLLVNLIVSVQSGDNQIIISGLYETLLAIIIFLIIPDKFGEIFKGLFYNPQPDSLSKSVQEDVSSRLKIASDALFNIGNSINEVTKKLTKIDNKEMNEIANKVQNNICRLCGLKTLCWETKSKETLEAFENMKINLFKEKQLNIENMPQTLINRCCKVSDINNYVTGFYRENQIRNTAQKRILEVKSFVSEQFSDMSKILYDISSEYKKGDTFDFEMAKKISSKLRSLNIIPSEVICKYDAFNRFSLEIEFYGEKKETIEKLNLDKVLAKVCRKKLDIPCIIEIKNTCKVNISQKPNFKVDVGTFQHTCSGESLCGDNYTYFNDGKGRAIIILSDGMGTGCRAAIEGAMACEIMSSLVKSGIGFETAIKVTNSCLFVKSEDESFATLDIVCLDLFTGIVNIIKAGAPISLIKKNDDVIELDLPSLPVGILKNINFINKKEILFDNDKILLISDGVLHPDEFWIKSAVKDWDNETSNDFAKRIVSEAVANRYESNDDDITAIAIKISKV